MRRCLSGLLFYAQIFHRFAETWSKPDIRNRATQTTFLIMKNERVFVSGTTAAAGAVGRL